VTVFHPAVDASNADEAPTPSTPWGTCPTCRGVRYVTPYPSRPDLRYRCADCEGDAQMRLPRTCNVCGGYGKVPKVENGQNVMVTCPMCNGKGKI
jgi:hypothetical protein